MNGAGEFSDADGLGRGVAPSRQTSIGGTKSLGSTGLGDCLLRDVYDILRRRVHIRGSA